MRVFIFLIMPVILAGCAALPLNIFKITTVNNPAVTASEYVGLQEYHNRNELKELMGVDPVRTEWCAAFVNSILGIESIPNLYDINHPAPLTARAFLQWGDEVAEEDIKIGDLVIFPRGTQGWQGHVGFYAGKLDGKWIILGGNQDQSVSYALYNPHAHIGIRRYTINNTTQSTKNTQ
jgi:uncharacterized protein (TIGR02594 family)